MANSEKDEKSVVSQKKGWVKCDVKLDGKVVIITGGNTGIGYETAKDLVQRGAKVYIACRNEEKGNAARSKIIEDTKIDEKLLITKQLDLASLQSVKSFSESIKENEEKIDILINNAGVMACPKSETSDGFDMQFGTNHLGHFLLTNLLLDNIKASSPSRIINVSSDAHKGAKGLEFDDLNNNKSYTPWSAYCRSKLANILFTRELSKKLEGTGVTANSLHPGVVRTELWRHMFDKKSFWRRAAETLMTPIMSMTFKTPEHGAQTSIYCAVAPELTAVTGKYFSDCAVKSETNYAKNDEDARKLWAESEKLVGLNSEH